MSQLAHLRHKIRSIQTTKKITHAVRLVSMAFYNKLDKANQPLTTYNQQLKNTFIQLLADSSGWVNTVLTRSDVLDQRPLFVVVSTSKGLCGSLNSNLFRYLQQALFLDEKQEPFFIAIGTKAITHLKKQNKGVLVASYPEVTTHNLSALADELIEKIMFGSQPYSSVSFFSSQAKSFFFQRPIKTTVLPLAVDNLAQEAQQAGTADSLIWEQSKQEVLDFVAARYLRSIVMQILFDAMRAEHAARFLAMENSTNNAEKYLERLTLQFNKMRQAAITKEISELSAGMSQR
ncbi:F0F1 ATP synthase subunit gamma [bacterium]|nr:F0F1 ATP synthase subunit gamma [bacterium]